MDTGDNSITQCRQLIQLLEKGICQDPDMVTSATQTLKLCETQPGFYTLLAQIFSQSELSIDIRMMSILYLKNCIDRYWRPNAPQGVSEEEKSIIRDCLLVRLEEYEKLPKIGFLLAVLIGKISRLDWPRYWPQLLQILITKRAWITMLEVVKNQASKRLAPSRAVFHQLAGELLLGVRTVWGESLRTTFSINQANQASSLLACLEEASVLTKILRCVVADGVTRSNTEAPTPEVRELLELAMTSLTALASMRQSLIGLETVTSGLLASRDKLARLLCKLIVAYQDKNPQPFTPLIQSTLEQLINLLTNTQFSEPPKVRRQGLLLLNNLLTNYTNNSQFSVAMAARNSALLSNSEVLPGLLTSLVRRDAQLSADSSPPETDAEATAASIVTRPTGADRCGESRDQPDQWKLSVCELAEHVIYRLVSDWLDPLGPIMCKLIESMLSAGCQSDQETCLRLLGLTLTPLSTCMSLDEVIPGLVTRVLAEPAPPGQPWTEVIQRRAVWLLARWSTLSHSGVVSTASTASNRRNYCYPILATVLSWNGVVSVRMEVASTVQTIRESVPSRELSTEDDLTPWIQPFTAGILRMIQESNDCEIQLTLVKTLQQLLENMDVPNQMIFQPIIDMVPVLWNKGEGEPLFQVAIIDLVVTISTVLAGESTPLVELAARMVSSAMSGEDSDALLEACLLLVQTMMTSLAQYPTPLDEVFPLLTNALAESPEWLLNYFSVCESYIFLGGATFLNRHLTTLLSALLAWPPSHWFTVSANQLALLNLLEDVLLVEPSALTREPPLLVSLVTMAMTGVLTSSPVQPDTDQSPLVTHARLSLLARCFLVDNKSLMPAVNSLIQKGHLGGGKSEVFGQLMDRWLARLDNMAESGQRRSCAIASLSMLTLCPDLMEEKFDAVINACVQIIHEEASNPPAPDLSNQAEGESAGQARRRVNRSQDPLIIGPVLGQIQVCLRCLESVLGDVEMRRYMETIDPVISNQLMSALASNVNSQ